MKKWDKKEKKTKVWTFVTRKSSGKRGSELKETKNPEVCHTLKEGRGSGKKKGSDQGSKRLKRLKYSCHKNCEERKSGESTVEILQEAGCGEIVPMPGENSRNEQT